MRSDSDLKRELLRHALATLAYRGGKAVRNAPANFAEYSCSATSRTPGQILAHIGDLLDWGRSIARGKQTWRDSGVQNWNQDVERFFSGLKAFDDFLASDHPLEATPEKLFQGPIADALTHVGQIAMLRRMAGAPMKGESYFAAEAVPGRVGREQTAPKREFD